MAGFSDDNPNGGALFEAANKLRGSVESAEYKHLVLGLLFLKYISDAFEQRRQALEAELSDPACDGFLADAAERREVLEDRDEYVAENVFWVPESARWPALLAAASQPDVARRIDDALSAIEQENPALANVLPRVYARAPLSAELMGSLVETIAKIGFGSDPGVARDVLGRTYEYFIKEFARSEGHRGGEFFTPAPVARLLVEMLEPYQGRVLDPACGSCGLFVQSARFIAAHGGRPERISIYGQERNQATWRIGRMNLAIHGLSGEVRYTEGGSLLDDAFPMLKADFVMANPPFNQSQWSTPAVLDDARWAHGTPPTGNANYAWIQHFLHHLAPDGRAGFVMANGSLTTMSGGEGKIREGMIRADVVDCIVALPPQLFYTTGIPVCLWFLDRNKASSDERDRRGETLFIDARQLGRKISRTQIELSAARRSSGSRRAITAGAARRAATTPTSRDSVGAARWTRSRRPGSRCHRDAMSALPRPRRTRSRSRSGWRRWSIGWRRRWRRTSGWRARSGGRWGGWAMRSEWPRVPLAELCVKIGSGATPRGGANVYVDDGARFIRSQNVYDLRFESAGMVHLDDRAAEHLRGVAVQSGDVLVNITGDSVARVCLAPTDDCAARVSQHVAIVRPAPADLLPKFLAYWLVSPRVKAQLLTLASAGATRKALTKGMLESLQLSLPPANEQVRIASILGALDDKIDNNRRLAMLLEQTAAELFRARFVDFVGVEEFEDSEIGRIPRGWRPGSLADIARFVNGRAFTKEADGVGRPILRIRELNGGIANDTPRSDIVALQEHVARHHDILFAWSGSLDVYRWCGPESLINQHIFKVIPERYPPWFVHHWIRHYMAEFRAIARDKATTMGHIQRRHLYEAFVPLPDTDTLRGAEAVLGPIDNQLSVLASEAATLTAIRDALLPKLISGAIRVRDTTDPAELKP